MLERESLFFVASLSSRLGGNQQCTLSYGCLGAVKRYRLLDIRHRLFPKCAWRQPRMCCFTWLSRLSKAAPLFGYPTPFIRFKCFALRECAGPVKRRLFQIFTVVYSSEMHLELFFHSLSQRDSGRILRHYMTPASIKCWIVAVEYPTFFKISTECSPSLGEWERLTRPTPEILDGLPT